jgi:putative nucleotidyltransferase with HDIG domain
MSAASYVESEGARRALAAGRSALRRGELRGELFVGGAYVLAAGALAVLGGSEGGISLPLAALYVAAIAAVCHVRFDFGEGFTFPTQVVFVPMLFALPVALVPVFVSLALALAMAPAILSRRVPASRLLTVPSNSWYAWGPAMVLWLAGDHTPNGRWGILLLALLAQLAGDFLANLVRERLRDGVSLAELLAESRVIYMIDVALAPLGLLTALAVTQRTWAVVLVAPLFGVMRWFSRERRARLRQLIELNDAYRGTALVLGDVVEADDAYTGEHCKSVVALALDVARELGLGPAALRKVEFAALLHDVGKIAVPNAIVNKPGSLDPSEWAVIKTHTIEGQRMLEQVGGFMSEVGEIVRSSHERWDGSGYPDGLRGSEIPLEARIVSCCDAFNAMTTTRPYRDAMSVAPALVELRDSAATQFDPAVVSAVTRVVEASERRAAEARARLAQDGELAPRSEQAHGRGDAAATPGA